ncbi:MAG: complement resistance protein TraT [Geminicoccaceae bacterium]
MTKATLVQIVATASLLVLLAGCAGTSTAISKRNLEVETRMTDTIFLDPVAHQNRTVFVQIRNTSDRSDLDIEQAVRAEVEARGYRIVEDPSIARYWLQANVLQAGVMSPSAAEQAYSGGFGSVIVGGATGAAAGAAVGDTETAIVGGLIGAAVSTVVDSFVSDVTYTIVTDLQVSERVRDGIIITETVDHELIQGTSGTTRQNSIRTTDWQRYQTRVVSTANKANLEFEEASPDLVAGLTRSIAGIF